MSHYVYVSPHLCLSIYLSLHFSVSLTLLISISVPFCLAASLSLYLSVFHISVFLHLVLSPFLSLYLATSPYLCLAATQCLFLLFSCCLCLPVSVYFQLSPALLSREPSSRAQNVATKSFLCFSCPLFLFFSAPLLECVSPFVPVSSYFPASLSHALTTRRVHGFLTQKPLAQQPTVTPFRSRTLSLRLHSHSSI